MRTITMIIPRDGISTGKTQIKIETAGFVGSACQSATEAMNRALGMVTDTELTPEFYATNEPQHEYLSEGGQP